MNAGFQIIESLFSESEVSAMQEEVERSPFAGAGSRQALSWPWVKSVAADPRLKSLVGANARPVRGILFDKTPSANWNLGFHQDRAIALRRRLDVTGFSGWSVKDGVPHALAPASVLEKMTAIRISLDDCGPDNGPLRVLPDSHRQRILDRATASAIQDRQSEVVCLVRAGGVVVMKPLLLHASSAASSPRHRRVLHIEYFEGELPGGLEFYDW